MINITNNSTNSVFVYLKRNQDLHQIAYLEGKECILRDLQKGQILEFKLTSQIGEVTFPSKTFKMKEVGEDSFIIIR